MKRPDNNQDNFALCICGGCPLYTDCNKEKSEKLFCARMKSSCEMDAKKMCICPTTCQVYKKNDLRGAYFCIKEISG